MSTLSRSLALGFLFINNVLGASISRQADSVPRSAIAVKLNPVTLQARNALSGVQIVEELVRSVQNASHTKRDTEFNVLPLITSLSPEQIAELVAKAIKITPSYVPADFSAWYQVQFESESLEDGRNPEIVNLLKALGAKREVANCQPLGGSKAPAVSPSNDPQFTNQGYLKTAPGGINAQYAWGFAGGDGTNTKVIDVERGWKLDHEDLVSQNITLLAGMNVRDRYDGNYPHGTAVLGEMLMADNNKGGVGIAPKAKGHVVGIQRTVGGGPVENQPEAILDAASFLAYGDVMVLEMQVSDEFLNLWPVEIYDAEFDAIQLAVALGITVIEPAANGGVNMDTPITRPGDPAPKSLLNKTHPDFRDSGAIIVGAGSSTTPRTRLSFSNYGGRVDVHAWGQNIRTSSVNVPAYTDSYADFDGTSGAAPIVAGAALSMQGIVKVRTGSKLSPAALRNRIKIGGTLTSNPTNDKIGVQPNLKALIDGGHLNYL